MTSATNLFQLRTITKYRKMYKGKEVWFVEGTKNYSMNSCVFLKTLFKKFLEIDQRKQIVSDSLQISLKVAIYEIVFGALFGSKSVKLLTIKISSGALLSW